MHKNGVTKYQLDWQVIRVLSKKFKTVQDKTSHVRAFFDEHPTQQRYVRVVNYLEGLHMGYRKRNEAACEFIDSEIAKYGSMHDYIWDEDDSKVHRKWDEKIQIECYKDNMKRYKNYTSKGYVHMELKEFLMSFKFADKDYILQLEVDAKSKPNTHHFFF